MSAHFALLVELDLIDPLSDGDLAITRWLLGLGEEPTGRPPHLEPLISGRLPADPATVPWLPVPGGVTNQLQRRRLPAGADEYRTCWSVALRDQLLDDHFYEGGLRAILWLGAHSQTEGSFAQAREIDELMPSWNFFVFDHWTFVANDQGCFPCQVLDSGELVEDPAAPPPPALLVHTLAKRSGAEPGDGTGTPEPAPC